jgi:hypothetical protein
MTLETLISNISETEKNDNLSYFGITSKNAHPYTKSEMKQQLHVIFSRQIHSFIFAS